MMIPTKPTGLFAAMEARIEEIKAKSRAPCTMVGSHGKHSWNINGNECSCGAMYKYTHAEFRPKWELPARDKLVVALTIALPRCIANWQGCSDEELEAVAAYVLQQTRREDEEPEGR